MALSRELTRKFNVDDEPLSKRLKLAENTFTSVDLPITRKEDLVLTWLCRVVKINEEDDNSIWSTLSRCLVFKNACDTVILKTDVKQMLVETMIAKFARTGELELNNVIRCCEMIFASREMHGYFRSDAALFCEFMKALFELISRLSKSTISEKYKFSNTNDSLLRICAINAIQCFVTCYKQSTNKERLASMFVSKILYPLCSLVDKSESDKLGAEIHKCVQQTIFEKSRYSQYKEYNRNEENFVGKLYEELRKNAETADEDISVVVFLYVFRASVGSYKNDPAAIDAIFRYLVDSAAKVKIKVLASLREQMTSVTFDYQNKIGDTTLFEYLQSCIDEILMEKRLKAVDYEALGVITVLNPLIVETRIQALLNRILLEEKETGEDRAAYRDLMIVVTNAAVRLRREQKLVSWILTALEERIKERDNCELEIDQVFPKDFKKQFSKAVANMTSIQTIGVFRALIFHLDNCVETFAKDKHIATFMLKANVDLISAYFEGVRIFEHSVVISGQEKFIQALTDLGKTISILTERVLNIKKNKKIIVPLLTVVWYWDNVYNWMRYYVPEAVVEVLDFPISDEQMRQIVENVDNSSCKKAMNRILIHQIGRNLQRESSPDLTKLLDGLDTSWSIILDECPQIVSSMDNSQIAELARYFLDDIRSSDCSESMERLSNDYVENDERFVKALVCQTLVDIAMNVDESTTKIVTGYVNVIKILDRGKLSKIFKEIKKEFVKNEWSSMSDESISVMVKSLKILLNLPLKHLSLDLRTLIFLVVYSIKKECEQNTKISQLYTEITLDLSEKFDIDIIDYFDPDLLIRELICDKSIQRIFESSLRNITSWETLKIFINNSQRSDESVTMFLESIERVRSKLKNDQKEVFKKAELRLVEKLLDSVDVESANHRNTKRLTVALKVSATNGEISDNLVDITKTTLNRIFVSEASKDEKLVAEGLHLVNVVLKHRGKLALNNEIIGNVWPHVLKNSMKDLVQPLVETTEPKGLSKLFTLLHTQTISGLNEANKHSFGSSLTIWNSITRVRMGGIRHKLRITALHNLLQTLQISKIPVNFWPDVLKLVQMTLSDELHVIEKGIDVVFLLAGRSLKEAELFACDDVLSICSSLVKFNVGIITDRLPILLTLYRKIVRLVVQESRSDIDSSRERKLRCLALDIEKFTNSLIKLKNDLARISPYVIADLVEIFSEGVIPSHVKGPLEDSAGHFLSISDHHAISLLSRTLPTATQGIFKTLYETYNQFYKFTGKI